MKIREMTSEEFWPLFEKNKGKVFNTQQFNSNDHMTVQLGYIGNIFARRHG
jgi:hypothetical protein